MTCAHDAMFLKVETVTMKRISEEMWISPTQSVTLVSNDEFVVTCKCVSCGEEVVLHGKV